MLISPVHDLHAGGAAAGDGPPRGDRGRARPAGGSAGGGSARLPRGGRPRLPARQLPGAAPRSRVPPPQARARGGCRPGGSRGHRNPRRARGCRLHAPASPLAAAPPSPSESSRSRRPATSARSSSGVSTTSTTPSAPTAPRSTTRSASRRADLTGRVALVTGARVKIGFQTSLKILRAGARVIATTRFPHDAARRYAREPDFADWRDRLSVHGLDLRHAPSVELFARYVEHSLRAPRHPREQRLPDRAPSPGLLRAPAAVRGGAASRPARASCARSSPINASASAPSKRRLRCRRRPRRRWTRPGWRVAGRGLRRSASGHRRACPRSATPTTTPRGGPTCSPTATSTWTCSRWTCAPRTPGGSRWPRCRRRRCSRSSSSTRSRRSSCAAG